MNNEEILKYLDTNLDIIDLKKTQDEIDELITYCIKNDLREKAWRIALSFPEANYLTLAEYYLQKKDSWYLSELLYVIGFERFSDILPKKILETKDNVFIKNMSKEYMAYFGVNTIDELKKKLNIDI